MKRSKLGQFMVKRGGSVDPSKFRNETFELLSIPAFDQGHPEVIKGEKIGSAKKIVQPSDVLLSKIVSHIRRCWVVPASSKKRQIASGEWIQFRGDEFFPEYLRLFLISNGFHSQFMKTVKGVGGSLLRASPEQVAEIEIPLPAYDEQIRIAHLVGKVERLITLRKEHLLRLDNLLKSVFAKMFGDPLRNEKGWATSSLTSYGSFKNGLNYSKGESGAKVRYLGVGDFKFRAKLDAVDKLAFVELNELPAEDYFLQNGDLVFVRSNGNRELVGRCMAVYPGAEKVTYSGFCIRYRINDPTLQTTYIAHLFRSSAFREVLLQGGQGANIQNINQQILSSLPIPIPPKGLQSKFASIVDKVEGIKGGYQRSLSALEALYGALSQKAFKGELDLSRVLISGIEPQKEQTVTKEPWHSPAEQAADIKFPNTDNWLDAHDSAEPRELLIVEWLKAYCWQLGGRPFSVQHFMTAAQARLTELYPDRGFQLGANDYDQVKTWVFKELADGRLTQARNITGIAMDGTPTLGNMVQLAPSQT